MNNDFVIDDFFIKNEFEDNGMLDDDTIFLHMKKNSSNIYNFFLLMRDDRKKYFTNRLIDDFFCNCDVSEEFSLVIKSAIDSDVIMTFLDSNLEELTILERIYLFGDEKVKLYIKTNFIKCVMDFKNFVKLYSGDIFNRYDIDDINKLSEYSLVFDKFLKINDRDGELVSLLFRFVKKNFRYLENYYYLIIEYFYKCSPYRFINRLVDRYGSIDDVIEKINNGESILELEELLFKIFGFNQNLLCGEVDDSLKYYDRYINKNGCNCNINFLKEALLLKVYNLSLENAIYLVEKYGNDIENLELFGDENYSKLVEIIKSIKRIVKITYFDHELISRLINKYNSSNGNKDFMSVLLLEDALKQLYAVNYNRYLNKRSNLVYSYNEGDVSVLEAVGDFSFLVSCREVDGYNYFEYYNKMNTDTRGRSSTLISNDSLGIFKFGTVIFGFDDINIDSLYEMGPSDLWSFNNKYSLSIDLNKRLSVYVSPNNISKETRYGYNEFLIKQYYYRDGVKVKHNPSYILYFKDNDDYKDDPFYEESIRAASEFGNIPVYIIDRRKVYQREEDILNECINVIKIDMISNNVDLDKINNIIYRCINNYCGSYGYCRLDFPVRVVERLVDVLENVSSDKKIVIYNRLVDIYHEEKEKFLVFENVAKETNTVSSFFLDDIDYLSMIKKIVYGMEEVVNIDGEFREVLVSYSDENISEYYCDRKCYIFDKKIYDDVEFLALKLVNKIQKMVNPVNSLEVFDICIEDLDGFVKRGISKLKIKNTKELDFSFGINTSDLNASDYNQFIGGFIVDYLLDSFGEDKFAKDLDSGIIYALGKRRIFNNFKNKESRKTFDVGYFYNDLFNKYIKGEFELDIDKIIEFVDRVSNINDSDYMMIFIDYFNCVCSRKLGDQFKFVDVKREVKLYEAFGYVMNRKNNLRSFMNDFLIDLIDKKKIYLKGDDVELAKLDYLRGKVSDKLGREECYDGKRRRG